MPSRPFLFNLQTRQLLDQNCLQVESWLWDCQLIELKRRQFRRDHLCIATLIPAIPRALRPDTLSVYPGERRRKFPAPAVQG